MKKISKSKNLLIFVLFGLAYGLIEILWRGYTHPSMFVVGGSCGLFIGLINEYTPKMPMIKQMLLGTIIVLVMEFISGCILNLWLELNVWNYSNLPFNILGQVCPQFAFIWFLLSYVVIKLDDYLRGDR